MNEIEAKDVLKQASSYIDWHNFGVVMFNLGELGLNWNRHTNDRWLPSYQKAKTDNDWLKENWEKVVEAIEYLHDNRPKRPITRLDTPG